MATYQFYREQKIPATLDEVWAFISKPENLKHITPPHMGFDITSKYNSAFMYPGMMVCYIVKPILGIPMAWVSEITHVKDRDYFVDEQRIGPYKIWHHEHRLLEIEGGVLLTDLVTYTPPLGFLGALANKLFIKKQLEGIFAYRFAAAENIFGKFNQA